MELFMKKEGGEKGKRRGRGASPPSKPSKSPAVSAPAPPSARLEIDMESPPLVLYGSTQHSTGALLSGQLFLHVAATAGVTISSLDLRLEAHYTSKRPAMRECADCKTLTLELHHWRFVTESAGFAATSTLEPHTFPFSHLLPGHLPATTDCSLGAVDYILTATATTSSSASPTIPSTVSKVPATFRISRALVVTRALATPHDRQSLRVFPPTHLAASLVLPPAIHPIGVTPLHFRLTGIVDNSDPSALRRWRVRKLVWRIEEHTQLLARPCSRHAPSLAAGKGIVHSETRDLAQRELREGWKTDWTAAAGGLMELEFDIGVAGAVGGPVVCDTDSKHGLTVRHTLVVELVVTEEVAPANQPRAMVLTGTARVLRMQFALALTERSGLGISWDEEQPPVYEDVPDSPPGYARMDEWVGDVAEGGLSLER